MGAAARGTRPPPWAQTEDPGPPGRAQACPLCRRRGRPPAEQGALSHTGFSSHSPAWHARPRGLSSGARTGQRPGYLAGGAGGAPAKGNELEIRPQTSCGPQTAEPTPLGPDPYQPGRRWGQGTAQKAPERPPGTGVGKQLRSGPGSEGDPLGRPRPAPRALQRGPWRTRPGVLPAANTRGLGPGPAWPGLAEAPGRPGLWGDT